jgi:uncharacterized membrane protein YdjX (TVP38/TMEM64 family)
MSVPSVNTTHNLTGHKPRDTDDRGGCSGAPTSGRIWLKHILTIGLASTIAVAFIHHLWPQFALNFGQVVTLVGQLDAGGVRDWVLSFGAFSPLAYLLVVVAQVIVSPIPAGPVTLADALVFGVWKGLALSMAGSVAGSALVFAAARKWGEPLGVRIVGKETYLRYSGKLDARGWWLFVILLVPFMPDHAVCALAGLSAVPFRRFLALVVVGRLPGATLTALLASGVVTGSTAVWITAGVIIVALVALGIAYRKRLEFWVLRRAGNSRRGNRLLMIRNNQD